MKEYRVEWTIDLTAESHREAAQAALEIMQDPAAMARMFSVKEFDSDEDAVDVDLLDDDEAQEGDEETP